MIDEKLLKKLFTEEIVLGDDVVYVRDSITMFEAFDKRDIWYVSLDGGIYHTTEGVNGLLHFIDCL